MNIEKPPAVSRESHLPLLKAALSVTSGPVLELGSGDGSTPFLHEHCLRHDRYLFTAESHPVWYEKWREMAGDLHRLALVRDWLEVPLLPPVGDRWAVVLVDNHPPETRRANLTRFQGAADIIVAHDTEQEGRNSCYRFTSDLWIRWRYVLHDGRGRKGDKLKRTSALSDRIDVSRWTLCA